MQEGNAALAGDFLLPQSIQKTATSVTVSYKKKKNPAGCYIMVYKNKNKHYSFGFIDNNMGEFWYVTFTVAITKPTVWEINSK